MKKLLFVLSPCQSDLKFSHPLHPPIFTQVTSISCLTCCSFTLSLPAVPFLPPAVPYNQSESKYNPCQNASVTSHCLQNEIQMLIMVSGLFVIWTQLCFPSLTASFTLQILAIINYLQFSICRVFLYFSLFGAFFPLLFNWVTPVCLERLFIQHFFMQLFLNSLSLELSTLPKCSQKTFYLLL